MGRKTLPPEIRRHKRSYSLGPATTAYVDALPKRKRSEFVDKACQLMITSENVKKQMETDSDVKDSSDTPSQ